MNNKYLNIHETREDIDEPIINVYPYGSVVYGSTTKNSDEDFIAVVDSKEYLYYSVKTEDGGDITVYSEPMFIKRMREHHISVLECIFQNENDKYAKDFHLVPELLRREISSVSSNSFVKCKKKMAIGEDYTGKKSIFHSLRIKMFGIQIARYGKIINYSEANYLLPIIMELKTWNEVKDFCQPIHNELHTQFKLLAPIDKDY